MQFLTAAAAVALLASSVAAFPSNGTTTTEVVNVYVTYCPVATTIYDGDHTVVVEQPGEVTLSHGPYTVTRPVYTTSSVICSDGCTTPAAIPVPTGHSNGTIPVVPTYVAPTPAVSSSGLPVGAPTAIPTAGAARVAGAAGAGLAAVLGFAVFAL